MPPAAGRQEESVAGPQTQAVLFIHAVDRPVGAGLLVWLQQFMAAWLPPPRPEVVPSLNLRVQDLLGHGEQHITPALTVNRLCLPAGPYLVTAQRANTRRGYYLNLAPGSEVDLFLDLDLDR